ncbi:winged helix-turn-helix domain-containing protein [Microcoleus sp. AT9_B5]
MVRNENLDSFKDNRMKGNYRKATEKYINLLLETVEVDPEKYGYEFGRWTTARLAIYLGEQTGIELSSTQVRRILNPHSAVLALMNKDFHTFSVGKISVPTFSNFSIIILRFWRDITNLNSQIFPNIFIRQYLNSFSLN